MSMPIVALVADEEAVAHPELLGLSGENLAAQRWLALLTSADEARAYLAKDSGVQEVWVAACGPIAPINLAATLKRDRSARRICMLSAQESGSLLSRSSAAGIDASLSPQAFVERYSRCKQLAMQGAFGGQVAASSGAGYAVGGGPGGGSAGGFSGGAGVESGAGSVLGAGGFANTSVGGAVAAAGAGAGVSAGAAAASGGMPLAYGSPSGTVPSSASAGAGMMPPVGSSAPAAAMGLASSGSYAAGAMAAGAVPAAAMRTLSGQMQRPPEASPRSGASAFAATPAQGQGQSRQGLLIPVVSASGGCGKSAVALLAAYLLQAAGFNTLLLDFDLQFGDMAELVGVERPLRIDEVLKAPAQLSGLKSEGNVPALLAAPVHVDSAEAVVDQAADLIDGLRTRFDIIVANTGAAWAEQHAVLLERASKVLFLVDQRQTSIRTTRRALDLCARCGIAVNPFVFALNGCGKGAPLTSMDVSCALKGAEVRELRDGGSDIEDLLAANAPLELLDCGNALCESLLSVLADMLPAEQAEKLHADDESSSGGLLFRSKKPRRRKRG